MNKLIATALAMLIVTPALATPSSHHLREAPASTAPQLVDHDVALRDGFVMGQDPDSHVRFELRRDNPTY